MSAKERLQKLQAELEQRGAKDVKFCFSRTNAEVPLSHVANDVADALQALIDGRCTPMAKLGDSMR